MRKPHAAVEPASAGEPASPPSAKTRLSRQERREKQRAENPGRAAEMHAARIQAEKSGALLFPPPPLPHADAAGAHATRKVHIGCSGWFYWHWKGGFYPLELPTSRWFSHYATRFDTVELNAPFYSWPTVAAVRGWIRQLGGRTFTYTVKVSELITHVKRFSRTRTLVRDFGHIADLLGGRMGCFLYQLPPSFHYSPARLRRILDQLEPGRRNVVEFRHRTWWRPRVYDAFREYGAIFCSCSAPGLPEDLIRTSGDVYIRFHGRQRWYRHDYSEAELEAWAEKIRGSGAREVWAYFNNDWEGHAPRNAAALARMLAPAGP